MGKLINVRTEQHALTNDYRSKRRSWLSQTPSIYKSVLNRVTATSCAMVLVLLTACEEGGGSSGSGSGPAGGEPPLIFLGNPNAPQGTALYVDGDSGNDSGTGSQAAPYQTITQAITAARDLTPPVEIYITAKAGGAAYQETLTISKPRRNITVPTGTSLFGGYSPNWIKSTGDRSLLETSSRGIVFDELSSDAAMVGLSIVSAPSIGAIAGKLSGNYGVYLLEGDGNFAIHDSFIDSGMSMAGPSIGITAVSIAGLRVTNTTVKSQMAADGQAPEVFGAGRKGVDGEDGFKTAIHTGGAGGYLDGVSDHHQGGQGGRGNTKVGAGSKGGDGGVASDPGGAGGAGGFKTGLIGYTGPTFGANGANGMSGNHGDGGRGIGKIEGIIPSLLAADGQSGESGQAGYGGGGGGGGAGRRVPPLLLVTEGVGGGGGGSGGAGGKGGDSGNGGSGSIGIMLMDVPAVLIEGSTVTADDGGNGGNGGVGTAGGAGGKGSNAVLTNIGHFAGARGGDGGSGGNGGSGGGGAGGPSVGILAGTGTQPTIRNNVITTSRGGNAGISPESDLRAGEGGASVGIYKTEGAGIPNVVGNNFTIGIGGESQTVELRGLSAQTNF